MMRFSSFLCAVVLCSGAAFAQSSNSEIRRVVTTIDAGGKAVVLTDSQLAMKPGASPNPAANVWATESGPADYSFTADRTVKPGLMPPKAGTVLRIVDFVPTTADEEGKLPPDMMMKVAGAGAPAKGLPPKHPFMHRTRTVDYALILSGEIDMMLDDTVLHLKTGDVVVQQATNHAWINRGNAPCRVAFILMDAQEP
ncbi:MAG TPA: cupin domain-containing protein [Alphaproteobacteria bacterium]